METHKRQDFTTREIRYILENYLSLCEGSFPHDGLADPDYGCRIQKSRSLKAAFERPAELKSDIDRAFQQLKPTEKSVLITICIMSFQYHEVGYWWGLDQREVQNIEDYSIRKVKRILNNGKT